MKELLIRAIYVEMLGHDASFSHIYAVNLTQSKNLLVKRIGYLAASLFIDQNSEMIILMISTMQKDLQSRNHLEVNKTSSSHRIPSNLYGKEVGIIAQDITDGLKTGLLKEFKIEGQKGVLAVNYDKLSVYNLKAIQELYDLIKDLTKRVTKLEKGENHE